MAIRISRVVQTTCCVPVQWDAWTDEGQYLYLRYRQGVGSVTPYPSNDYTTWDPTVEPIIAWNDGTGGYDITLEGFAATAGLDLSAAITDPPVPIKPPDDGSYGQPVPAITSDATNQA
ncbi:hypothetical protein ABT167_27440 [Streptomyces sp. NPDC001792]|uniref:hypothetical protein n=1 Tax=Streptomyces sp. NPDC001792 TaxID=3154524 RepID=UPI0033174C4D